MHILGQAPIWLALVLMVGLAAIMGLYQAALGYALARWLPERGLARWLIAAPAAWLLMEWWRGWFLSGFSWLSLGYSQTDSWLAGFAPLLGVYGLSALLLVCAGALVTLLLGTRSQRRIAAVVLALPWLAGAALYGHLWTQPAGAPVSVAVVQGAIPQDEKWLESNRDYTLKLYQSLTEKVLGTRLIVWPESAPADVANDLRALHHQPPPGNQCARLGAGDGRAARGRRAARAALLQLGAGARGAAPAGTTRATWCRSRSSSRCRTSCARGCA